MNKLLIEIVKESYGFTTKQAKDYIKTISNVAKQYLIDGYKQTAKKAFYND